MCYRGYIGATNKRPDNIMINAIFRMHIQQRNEDDDNATAAFLRWQKQVEKTSVSLAANNLADGTSSSRTVLTHQFIDQNKVSTSWFVGCTINILCSCAYVPVITPHPY